jgi:hypothetical protein
MLLMKFKSGDVIKFNDAHVAKHHCQVRWLVLGIGEEEWYGTKLLVCELLYVDGLRLAGRGVGEISHGVDPENFILDTDWNATIEECF